MDSKRQRITSWRLHLSQGFPCPLLHYQISSLR